MSAGLFGFPLGGRGWGVAVPSVDAELILGSLRVIFTLGCAFCLDAGLAGFTLDLSFLFDGEPEGGIEEVMDILSSPSSSSSASESDSFPSLSRSSSSASFSSTDAGARVDLDGLLEAALRRCGLDLVAVGLALLACPPLDLDDATGLGGVGIGEGEIDVFSSLSPSGSSTSSSLSSSCKSSS